ncbi:hypothetical protein Efla_003614 [Eimeria flavescens]
MPTADFPSGPGPSNSPPPGGSSAVPVPVASLTVVSGENDTQTQGSALGPTPYQRTTTGLTRGDSGLLLGQRDFASTLTNKPPGRFLTEDVLQSDEREGLLSAVRTAGSNGGSGDPKIQQRTSSVSQLLLPLPSSVDDVQADAAAGDETEEAMSKHKLRLLFLVFCFQKFFCELLGTMFLVTSIALADKGSHGVLSPFSVSAVVYVLTFLFLPISGAHFNPAVSTAMFLTSKHFRYLDYGAYFICQLVGGTAGSVIGWAIMGQPLEVLPLDPGASSARTIFHEVIPTILLIYTCLVLSFATNAGDVSLLTIPLTASMAVLFGAIAGATMNPAVATGIYLSHLVVGKPQIMTRELLIGIFCPFLGALLSVFGFVITHAYTNPITIRFIHFI